MVLPGQYTTLENIMDIQQSLAVKVDIAADLLSVSRRTIWRLAKTGKIRIVWITPDSPWGMRADLEAFLSACEVADAFATDDAPDA